MEEIKISVGELIHFVMRSGDIDQSFYRHDERIKQGIKIHQKIQEDYGPYYQKEVGIKDQTILEDISFLVKGRMDGLYKYKDQVIIDEIKSTARSLEDLKKEENPLHWAQVQCYGYFYSKKHKLDSIKLQLTYCQLDSQEILKMSKDFSYQELEAFYLSLLTSYLDFSREILVFRRMRKDSIQKLSFPFPKYRKGQRKMATSIYRTIAEGKELLLEAPTGIGKTMSAIFPAIKAIGEDLVEKVFYCTSKHSIQEACHNALLLLMEGGLRCKSVNLTAKERICLNDEYRCNPKDCPYAKGHFDRVNACILEIYQKEDLFLREIIIDYAKKHRVCPGELQFDLCNYADFIIGDYNYVFDPLVYLRRFFDDVTDPYVFLVDEAHNLIPRSRDMYSKSLDIQSLHKVLEVFRFDDKEAKLYRYLLELAYEIQKRDQAEVILEELPEKILDLQRKILKKLEDYLTDRKGEEAYDLVLAFYFELFQWLKIAEYFDEHFRCVIEKKEDNSYLKILCLDSSELLKAQLLKAKSSIFFSATIKPLAFYGELLGLKDYYYGSLPSPFDEKNLEIAILPISLRYKDRGRKLRDYKNILEKFLQTPKNALVFFPSYAFMNQLVQDLPAADNYIIHRQDMDLEAREAFIENFQKKTGQKGFTVLGGSFSEGIDLVGKHLEEVLIFSVGLPGIQIEQKLMKEYFEDQGKNGFDYAYIYPGMNKVAQAAGRLIRSEEDRGKLVLVDNRFIESPYPALWPNHWKNIKTISIDALEHFMKG